MRLELKRWAYSPKGTFGSLRVMDKHFFTIERPWKDNTPSISCVPEGNYVLKYRPTTTSVPESWNKHSWYLLGDTVGLVGDGKARSNCCIHIANTMHDINGCIGAGFTLGSWAIHSSRNALISLGNLLAANDHELLIYRGAA